MYLFSRRGVLTGAPRETMPWAIDMTAYVSKVSGREVSLWQGEFGYPLGTVVWSVAVESLADLDVAFGGLADDDGFHQRLAAGAGHLSATEDFLRQPIHVPTVELALTPGAMVTTTTAVMGNGKYSEALGWGVEMAQLVEQVSGLPCMFLVDSYGDFGRVTWLSAAGDAASADEGNTKVNTNEEYMKRLADVGDLFIPGSGHRGLVRRIA
jgi:hypothetical protein